MPEKDDWRLKRPDFSGREKYEAAGWIKTDSYEVYEVNGKMWANDRIGLADPFGKFMKVDKYENDSLGLMAATFNFFEQGVSYVIWFKDQSHNPCGVAIKVNKESDDWVLKDPDETADIFPKIEKVNGKEIVTDVMVIFLKKDPQNGVLKPSFFIKITKED